MHNPLLRTLAMSTLFSASLASASDGQALAAAQGIAYPAVIAHRGASYDAPESTKPATFAAQCFTTRSQPLP